MPLPCQTGRSQRTGDVLTGAAAGIGEARGDKLVKSLLVHGGALRLVNRRLVGDQAAGSQLFKNGLLCTWNTARRVDVFNADQPTAVMRTGIEPAGERRDH